MPSYVRPYNRPLVPDPAPWMIDAACRDRRYHPDLWFSEAVHETERAKTVCRTCPVRGNCLEMALTVGEEAGVFGGLTAAERRRMRVAA